MLNKVFGVLLVFGLSISVAYGQSDCKYKKIIEKIDSISNVMGIYTGEVIINQITTSLGKTDTSPSSISKIGKFSFDGQFLVIENKYFNIKKLLYFEIKKKKIMFFLQAY